MVLIVKKNSHRNRHTLKALNQLLLTGKSLRFMACIIALFTLWGYKTVQNQFVQPQAILVLGGSTRLLEREKFTDRKSVV